VTGFVQIATFLVGLALMCMGGYIGLNALWNGTEKTIAADIGLRLVATGYVVAVACGMADVFGIGNQPLPEILILVLAGFWCDGGGGDHCGWFYFAHPIPFEAQAAE